LFEPADRAFDTDVGGRALLKFADGTQMELNTATSVRYRMTTGERTVWIDKGEAYFRVAHDATHPFVVIVGQHRVTDLGTEFLVRRDDDALEVALVRGRAELSSDDSHTAKAILTPGESVLATQASLTITKKTPQQLADELAWQRGVLVFRNTPLAEAVRQFNRYNRTKLSVNDPEVARLKVGGEFKADNVEDFLRLAEVVLKVRVQHVGNDILLSRDRGDVKRSPRGRHSQ
jgi:transmembrane sensor